MPGMRRVPETTVDAALEYAYEAVRLFPRLWCEPEDPTSYAHACWVKEKTVTRTRLTALASAWTETHNRCAYCTFLHCECPNHTEPEREFLAERALVEDHGICLGRKFMPKGSGEDGLPGPCFIVYVNARKQTVRYVYQGEPGRIFASVDEFREMILGKWLD